MPAISKNARVCETCGSSIETTSAGDLGCIACLMTTGLDAEAEQNDTAFALAPDQLGAYKIDHHADGSAWELGHGAMGVTYRAIDKALDRPVALKIINTDRGSHSAEARERFMREARAAAALRHPNVATVYQFGVLEGGIAAQGAQNGSRSQLTRSFKHGQTRTRLCRSRERRKNSIRWETRL